MPPTAASTTRSGTAATASRWCRTVAPSTRRGEPEAVCDRARDGHRRQRAGGRAEGHAELVAALATQTAERLGLPGEVVLRCRLGGWLHDIGKAAVPQQILDKPGPLDETEWAVMRTHPALGEAIVRDVAALRDAAAAVRHHHERFDGAGYPDGLAGEAIPVEARIVAAADAYAAMTGDRSYRAGAQPQEARRRAAPQRRHAARPRRGRRAARRARAWPTAAPRGSPDRLDREDERPGRGRGAPPPQRRDSGDERSRA